MSEINKETNQNINNGTINEIIDNETNKEKMNNNKLQTLIELKKLYKDKWKSEFTLECQKLGIEHRTTKPKHPWTNGQVEVFNRFIKDNTVNKYKYISKEQLVTHLDNLLIAYNFAKRLVSLKYITPYQKMLEIYNNKDLNKDNRLFNSEPTNYLLGRNTRA